MMGLSKKRSDARRFTPLQSRSRLNDSFQENSRASNDSDQDEGKKGGFPFTMEATPNRVAAIRVHAKAKGLSTPSPGRAGAAFTMLQLNSRQSSTEAPKLCLRARTNVMCQRLRDIFDNSSDKTEKYPRFILDLEELESKYGFESKLCSQVLDILSAIRVTVKDDVSGFFVWCGTAFVTESLTLLTLGPCPEGQVEEDLKLATQKLLWHARRTGLNSSESVYTLSDMVGFLFADKKDSLSLVPKIVGCLEAMDIFEIFKAENDYSKKFDGRDLGKSACETLIRWRSPLAKKQGTRSPKSCDREKHIQTKQYQRDFPTKSGTQRARKSLKLDCKGEPMGHLDSSSQEINSTAFSAAARNLIGLSCSEMLSREECNRNNEVLNCRDDAALLKSLCEKQISDVQRSGDEDGLGSQDTLRTGDDTDGPTPPNQDLGENIGRANSLFHETDRLGLSRNQTFDSVSSLTLLKLNPDMLEKEEHGFIAAPQSLKTLSDL